MKVTREVYIYTVSHRPPSCLLIFWIVLPVVDMMIEI